jgi:hypothetical protein
MANTLDGINLATLSEKERKGIVLFAEEYLPKITVEKGRKHEMVHDGRRYVGIVVFNNGQEQFRRYGYNVRYMRLCDTFVAPSPVD